MEHGQNTPTTDQEQTTTTQGQLELFFLLFLLQPSSKITKILIPLWRMRYQGCLQYGSIPFLDLLGYGHGTEPGMALRHWIHFQGVHSILDLLSWDPKELEAVPTQQVYHQDDQGQYIHLRINQVKQMLGLIFYMKYILNPTTLVLSFLMTHFIPFHLMNGPTHPYTNEDIFGSRPSKSSWA